MADSHVSGPFISVNGFVGNQVDPNGNEIIVESGVANAVNEITVTNAATGNPATIMASGANTNVSVRLGGKGTGQAINNGTSISKTTVSSISTAGNASYTADQFLGGLILRDCNGGDRADITPTAAALVASVPGCAIGDSFELTIRNTSAGAFTTTLTAASGAVTITGTPTIEQSNSSAFKVVITNVTASSEAYTVYFLGGSAAGVAVPGANGWYVDSRNGSDSNSGESPSFPLQTISALLGKPIAAYQTVYLAKESLWREQFTAPVNNLTVRSYGSGRMPILNAANVYEGADWSKTGGFTYVYQATVTHQAGEATGRFSVFENGRRMAFVANTTLCDSTAGTFTAAAVVPGTPQTVYIHPFGDTDPISDGNEYEIAQRAYSIRMLDDSVVDGIHGVYNTHPHGGMKAGNGALFVNCLGEDGYIHNLFMSSGLMQDCIAWKGEITAVYGAATLFIAYSTGSGANYSAKFLRCKAIGGDTYDSSLFYGAGGFYAHTELDEYDSLEYVDCEAINLGYGFGGSATSVVIHGGSTERLVNSIVTSSTDERVIAFTNYGWDPDIPSLRTIWGSADNLYVYGLRSVHRRSTDAIIFQQGNVTVESSTLGFVDHTSSPHGGIHVAAGTLAVNKCVFIACGINLWTGAGAVISSSNDNVYQGVSGDFIVDGVTYADFSAYRTAYPSLDVDSVSTATIQLLGDMRDGNFQLSSASSAFALGAGYWVDGASKVTAWNLYLSEQ